MKKLLAILLVSMLLATALVGCAPKADQSATEGSTEAATEATGEQSQEPVEITFWNYPNFAEIDGGPGAYEKQMVEAFNQKYPHITVKVEMLSFNGGPDLVTSAMASNTQPDLIYDFPGRIIDYARSGKMAPLNDMFDDAFKADVPENIQKACALDDNYYMYPFNTAPFMMAFNKTMLEKAGLLEMLPLDKEDRSWTVEEYEALMQAIKDKIPGVTPGVFYCKSTQGDQGTRAFVANLYGANVIAEDLSQYTLNTPEGVKGLEFVKSAIDKGLFIRGGESLTSNDGIDMFLQQKSASTLIYSAVLKKTNETKKQGEFEEVFMPFPNPNGPRFEAYIGGFGIFNNDPKKVEAAKLFVDFVTNDSEWGKKNLLSTGGLSVRASMSGMYDDSEAQYSERMVQNISTYYNHVKGFAEMRTFWFPELQGVIAGQITPQQALDNYVGKANETLK